MCGISAIYLLDKKGRVLISRAFRTDFSTNIQDIFNKKMMEFDQFTIKPIILDKEDNLFYFHRYNDIIVLAISKQNNNAIMVFSFMFNFLEVLKSYFKEVQEESIRDNFVIVYELLDQMMDNGYPQTTDYKMLSKLIYTKSFELSLPGKQKKEQVIQKEITDAFTNAVSWRVPGIKHSKNQFYLDVTQRLNMLIGPNNNIIKSQIIGTVKGTCQLSGMPDLKLGLNDKAYYEAQGRTSKSKAIQFNDIKFHQCVRLGKFENERMITFIPPDGEFELMSYRLEVRVKPLFSVEVLVDTPSTTRIKFLVKAKSNYKQKSTANNVEIFVPVPEDVENPNFKTNIGHVEYVPQNYAFKWTIKQYPGHREHICEADFKLPTIQSPNRNRYKKSPINIKFQIPYFTVSGFQVRYLKIVDKSGYKAHPWVRYLTKNGQYNIRTC